MQYPCFVVRRADRQHVCFRAASVVCHFSKPQIGLQQSRFNLPDPPFPLSTGNADHRQCGRDWLTFWLRSPH